MRQHHRRTLPCCLLAVGCVLPLSTPPATGAQGLDVLPGVKLDVEWRHRGEARGNADFDAGQADAQSGYLSRFRLGLGARLAPGLRTYVQVQDSRRVGDLKQRITNVTTLHQAFLELPAPEEGGTSLRVGRQYLSFGEKRLVSDSQWNNSARVFDGLRLTHRTDTYTLDYFSANVVTHRYQPAPAAPQGSFHGLYLSSGGGQRTVKELYTLARYRGGGAVDFRRAPAHPRGAEAGGPDVRVRLAER
ncbi:MAG: alginate export family protein [Armatimonadetes bacterium]|nr:alginate export family protein [Armatimonadota bacterium]